MDSLWNIPDLLAMKLHDRKTFSFYQDENCYEVVRVPGGWIYSRSGRGDSPSVALCFVPEPK